MINTEGTYASFDDEVCKKRGIESLMYQMQSQTHLQKRKLKNHSYDLTQGFAMEQLWIGHFYLMWVIKLDSYIVSIIPLGKSISKPPSPVVVSIFWGSSNWKSGTETELCARPETQPVSFLSSTELQLLVSLSSSLSEIILPFSVARSYCFCSGSMMLLSEPKNIDGSGSTGWKSSFTSYIWTCK